VLWVVVIVWLVLVGGVSAWLGIRATATARRMRVAEGTLNAQVVSLQGHGLTTLADRTAELQRQIAELERAFARLNRALEGMRILLAAWNGATGPARALLRFARR
jgi:TolA-binding protein